MQDKILTILESAKGWMTAREIADAGKFRSTSNVSVTLRNLGERVVSRKSKTKKFQASTEPLTEFKRADKMFEGDELPVQAVEILEKNGTAMPVDKECCNAAKIVATTAGAEVKALLDQRAILDSALTAAQETIKSLQDDIRRQVKRAESAEKKRDDFKREAEISDGAVCSWLNLAREYECKTIPELRVFINSAISRIETAKKSAKPMMSKPRRPFSVTGLIGYHAGNEKVTLFLDRRLSARSITLPTEKLSQLVDISRA